MKKISLLLLLVNTFVFAQEPQSYSELTAQGSQTIRGASHAVMSTNRNPVIDTYATFGDFSAAVIALCSDPTLTSEEFDTGPPGITNCGPIISSAGDGCFGVGVLEDGFNVQASNGADVVYISSGEIGNTDALVGAEQFNEFTIINLAPHVYAVAIQVWTHIDPMTDIRFYGPGGLITTVQTTQPVGTQAFFGAIADEPLSRVEVEGLNDSGELFGILYFGADCTLGIDNNVLAQISLFPNPATDVINIQVPATIEIKSVILYDVLGKIVSRTILNNQINVSELSRGIYLLNIETSRGNLTRKIIKK